MQIRLANAPVSWGVDYADDPANPPWRDVMDEIAKAGYRYAEIGPVGYFPEAADALSSAFAARGLTPVAGFLFQPLHDPARHDEVRHAADRAIATISGVGGRHLVVIDHISRDRMRSAGLRSARTSLAPAHQAAMIGLIDEICDRACAAGIRPALHQHAGCYIEYEDEVEAILDAIEVERLGVCVDTGHLAYAGIDAIAFHRAHAERVSHLHLKEVDAAVLARVQADGVAFLEATGMGVFCPLGRSKSFDWAGYAALLEETAFDGTATVEQDVLPTSTPDPLNDAIESRRFLEQVGMAGV